MPPRSADLGRRADERPLLLRLRREHRAFLERLEQARAAMGERPPRSAGQRARLLRFIAQALEELPTHLRAEECVACPNRNSCGGAHHGDGKVPKATLGEAARLCALAIGLGARVAEGSLEREWPAARAELLELDQLLTAHIARQEAELRQKLLA
jgi:hypothetical protein